MTQAKHPTADGRIDRRKNRHHRAKANRHKKNPCPHAPATIDLSDMEGTFYFHPRRRRHNRWTLKVRWPETQTDTDGFPLFIVGYAIQVEQRAQGSSDTWVMDSRHQVPAKNIDDDGSLDHFTVDGIHAKSEYRYKVRAFSRNCRGDWSDYLEVGTPDDTPIAPQDVEIQRASHGIRLTWEGDFDSNDDEIIDQTIAHYVAELWTADTRVDMAFTATNAGDEFTSSGHGMQNGDVVMLSRNTDNDSLPGNFKSWKPFYIVNRTTNTFQLSVEAGGSVRPVTSDGEGRVHHNLARKQRHIHKQAHRFRIDVGDFPEDTRFYGWVRAVTDHRLKSAYIPATAAGNDDPDATPDGRRPMWHRHKLDATIRGTVTAQTYPVPIRVDDDYRIRRVYAAFDQVTAGGATLFDIEINGSTFVFDGNTGDMVTIASGERRGASTAMTNMDLDRGDHIRVQAYSVTGTGPTNGTVTIVADRRKDGADVDTGGGD